VADPLLDDLFSASIDGLCVFDRDRHCTHWSPSMERLTGLSATHATGRTREELLPETEHRTYALSFQPTSTGGGVGVGRKSERHQK